MYEQTLKRISEVLIQQGVVISNPGLLHGKMGLVVFFLHYAKYTGDKSYEDYATVLMDSIQDIIMQQHVINYADGLAGIGIAVEYLTQNNFVEVNTNEVLGHFDKKIFLETVYGDRKNAGLFTGLSGLGRYFLFRVTGDCTKGNHIGTLYNKMSLIHITDIFERMCHSIKKTEIEDVLRFLFEMKQINIYPNKVMRLLNCFSKCNLPSNQYDMMRQYQNNMEELYGGKYNRLIKNTHWDTEPGLYGGLAGIGLYLLGKLDKQHETWMKLI